MIVFNEEFWRDLKKGIDIFGLDEDEFVRRYYAHYIKQLMIFTLAYMMEQAKKEGENQKYFQSIVDYFKKTLNDENADIADYDDMSDDSMTGLELIVTDPNYIMYLEKGMEAVIFEVLGGIVLNIKPEEREHVAQVFKKHGEIYANYKKEDVASKVKSMFAAV